MEIKQIRALAQILQQTGLSVLEITEGETKIRLERETAAPASSTQVQTGAATVAPTVAVTSPGQAGESPVDFNNAKEFTSPMVGVFYASPAPDAPPFVQIGSHVKKGDVLCIIEALKLMNEITAENDGEIVDICVENGQIVEYGQTIFKMI